MVYIPTFRVIDVKPITNTVDDSFSSEPRLHRKLVLLFHALKSVS